MLDWVARLALIGVALIGLAAVVGMIWDTTEKHDSFKDPFGDL